MAGQDFQALHSSMFYFLFCLDLRNNVYRLILVRLILGIKSHERVFICPSVASCSCCWARKMSHSIWPVCLGQHAVTHYNKPPYTEFDQTNVAIFDHMTCVVGGLCKSAVPCGTGTIDAIQIAPDRVAGRMVVRKEGVEVMLTAVVGRA